MAYPNHKKVYNHIKFDPNMSINKLDVTFYRFPVNIKWLMFF